MRKRYVSCDTNWKDELLGLRAGTTEKEIDRVTTRIDTDAELIEAVRDMYSQATKMSNADIIENYNHNDFGWYDESLFLN
jgi:hypothetical protein